MKVVRLAVIAVLVVAVLSACGSSHRRYYSLTQVKAAFATQGVHLRRAPKQVLTGWVVLRSGRRPNFIAVAVHTGKVRPGLQYFDVPSTVRHTRQGNLLAEYTASHSQAVKSALAELH
jgi:hypothetical protein